MNFKHLLPAVICLISTLFISCGDDDDNDDVICDFAPIIVSFNIQNDSGENLLSPDCDENIIGSNDITLIYEGQEYHVIWRYPPYQYSRLYYAQFFGLYYNPEYNHLCIGEFDQLDKIDKTFIVRYNGKDNTFRLVNDPKWKNKKPDFKHYIYLNGNETTGSMPYITK